MENPAVSLSFVYQCLTSCKKSEKSTARLLRYGVSQLTDGHFGAITQLKLRTLPTGKHLNFSERKLGNLENIEKLNVLKNLKYCEIVKF